MGTYRYEILLSDGKIKEGHRTAKTKEKLRQRLTKEYPIVEWVSLQEVPQSELAPSGKSKKPNSSKKLQKILYLQAGRCFFCGQPLNSENASIEHLNPKSKGGTNKMDNLVVCHKSLNAIFGDMELKRKFEFILKTAGSFKCPGV